MNNRIFISTYHLFLALVTILVAGTVFSCSDNSELDNTFANAEAIMNQNPDSALNLLNSIKPERIVSKKDKARYALLKSMALDKNYIDTTTFDVLQPAIDYYLENGSADERLRTLYYQGRIFLNRGDYDMAMQSFLKANDFKNECRDTLTYANMLVAQSILNFSSYQMEDYVSNNLIAANLYDKLNNDSYRQSSLIKALDGSIVLGNRQLSDSILTVVDSLVAYVPESQEERSLVKQTYLINFEPDTIIKSLLDSVPDYSTMDDASKLNVATGYLKLNQYKKADDVLKGIDPYGEIGKSYRYLQLRPEILEANGKYKEALATFKSYFAAIEKENSKIYYQKTTVAENIHDLELRNLQKIQQKNEIIWLSVCSVLIMLIVVGVIFYFYRVGRMKRVVAESEKRRLQLENDALLKQNAVLELEKHTNELTSENMRLRIAQLETENEQLKGLSDKEDLPDDVRIVIKERVEMLNSLFAARILDNDTNANAYDDWIRREINDKERFMNSNRLAFKASHPMFIKYLEEHGLTEYEINYLCLYAIGLKGKEVGNYMQLRRHYNISSEIRGKLGIDEHETNIGIYIKKLLKRL